MLQAIILSGLALFITVAAIRDIIIITKKVFEK